jgi:hypothetical protein
MSWATIRLRLRRLALPLVVAFAILPLGPSQASVGPATLVAIADVGIAQPFPNPGACTRFFRAWRAGHDDDAKLDACMNLMGINQYCANHDSFVAVGYENDGNSRYLVCSPLSHPDSVGDQFVHLVNGIGQGLGDAFVAAVPFVGPVVAGVGCMYGQVYACAVLALEISDAAGAPLAGVAGEAFAIAAEVPKCTDGDVVSCAKLGAHGATAAGLTIPGKDAAQVASDAQLCDNGDFGACMRLGKAASDAGGVPQGLGKGNFVNAQDCLSGPGLGYTSGENPACTALGKEATDAHISMGGVPDGAVSMQSCASGNVGECSHLGRSLASLTGTPGIALGRVHSTTPATPPVRRGNEPMICAYARAARERNSPSAPALTAQCTAAGGDFTQQAVTALPAGTGFARPATRMKLVVPADPPICVQARSAKARNSPVTPSLEAQCRAAGGTP